MARTDPAFMLRMPADLKAKLEASAKASGRSVTAEILHRLEGSYDPTEERLLKLEHEVFTSEDGIEGAWNRIQQLERDVDDLQRVVSRFQHR